MVNHDKLHWFVVFFFDKLSIRVPKSRFGFARIRLGRECQRTQRFLLRCFNEKNQIHSRKLTAGGPQNDGLQKVTPLKNDHFWDLC